MSAQSVKCRAQACGSGGTAAGLALGCHLADSGLRVHAYGVCDTPDIFYDDIDALFAKIGATSEAVGENPAHIQAPRRRYSPA